MIPFIYFLRIVFQTREVVRKPSILSMKKFKHSWDHLQLQKNHGYSCHDLTHPKNAALSKGFSTTGLPLSMVDSTFKKTRWWFQIFFIFTPTWGRFPIWLRFFKWVETTNRKISDSKKLFFFSLGEEDRNDRSRGACFFLRKARWWENGRISGWWENPPFFGPSKSASYFWEGNTKGVADCSEVFFLRKKHIPSTLDFDFEMNGWAKKISLFS